MAPVGVPCSGGRPSAVMPPPGCGDAVLAGLRRVRRSAPCRHERLRLRARRQRRGLRRAGNRGRRIDAGRQDQSLPDLQRVGRAQVVELDERADRDALARGDAGDRIALLHQIAAARLQVQQLARLQGVGRRQAVEVDQRADRRVGALRHDRHGIAGRHDILAVPDLAERRARGHARIGRRRRCQHGVEVAAGQRRRDERDRKHGSKTGCHGITRRVLRRPWRTALLLRQRAADQRHEAHVGENLPGAARRASWSGAAAPGRRARRRPAPP